MNANNRTTRARRADRIAINGHFLDEVRTRLQSYLDRSDFSYLLLPEEHHHATIDDDAVVLRLPALTALQLYYDGILPVNREQPVDVSVGGKALGSFRVAWLRRPAESYEHHDSVLLRLERFASDIRQARESAGAPSTLVPLKLEDHGTWDPNEEYWGEEDEPIEDWAEPIIAHGPRPMFEMEQVLPGCDPDDIDSDPILQANALRERGRHAQARRLLSDLIAKDERCLDAHAHLGSMLFDKPKTALPHYARGVEIGRLSLGRDFKGVLPWGLIDNRPFLRCLHGYGLCLWKLERFEEAERVFEELLWLSPSDNLGVRFVLPRVRKRETWSDDE